MNVHEKEFDISRQAEADKRCSEDGGHLGAELDGGQDGSAAVNANGEAKAAPRRGVLVRGFRFVLQTLLPIAVLAAGFFGYRYFVATKPEPPRKPQVERAYTVTTQTAVLQDVQPQIELFGSTVAGREVDIRALVAGRVIETSDNLREGAIADQGETLLKIDPLDYETAIAETRGQIAEAKSRIAEFEASIASDKASLEFAKGQLELAETDLERAEPLAQRGSVAKRTVDDRKQIVLQRKQSAKQLENSIDVWRARISQQEAQVARLEASLERARQRLEDTSLTAPFTAYVTEVGAQKGRMLGVNDKVATLIDRDWVDVRFTLTDQQFGRMADTGSELIGREVTVSWDLGLSQFTYPAKIERVGARITASTGGVEVFARIANPLEPQPIRPGAFVTVRVPDAKFEQVVRLPSTALYNGDTVFVVENDRLQSRSATVVGTDGADLLIRGQLKPGETVLTSRLSTPGDGVLVNKVAASGS